MTRKKQVQVLLRAATARYPGANMGPENYTAIKQDWERMITETSIRRFLVGLQRACLASSFFPRPNEIMHNMEPIQYFSEPWKPSLEDLKRRSNGEVSFGEGDVLAVWKLAEQERSKRSDRRLSDADYDRLIYQIAARKES